MKRLLLDTHVFLWWRMEPERIAPAAADAIAKAEVVYVSLASAWEAAIKMGLGRLTLPGPFEGGVRDSQFEPLPIEFAHTDEVARLPMLHRDPFDRLLVAQARVEGLTLVTHDAWVQGYDVVTLGA